jgi:hypothetical protein
VRLVSVRGSRDGGATDAKVDTQGCGPCEDVADLEFELGVKSSAAEAEMVLIDFVAHALRSCKKTCREHEGADDLVLGVNSMIIQREGREPPPLALGYGPA